MKKLLLAVASLSIAAAPVFACPHEDKAETIKEEAPRTAENGKKTKKDAEKAPVAKEKKDQQAEKAPEKTPEKAPEKKTGEKVSSR